MAQTAKPRLRVGYHVEPIAPVAYVRANFRLAQVLGADDLWFSDHVRHILPRSFWATNPMSRIIPDLDAFYDPTAVIARFCRRRGPRMGTFVTDPVRRTPSDLARAWLTLHHLSGGNVVLGIGAGEAMNIAPVGKSVVHAAARLEDTLQALRAAWSAEGSYVTHEGPFHTWSDVSFPGPYRGTVPLIWVAAQGPRTCGTAGRLGDGWFNFTQDFAQWRAAATTVAEAAGSVGKDPATMDWSLATVVMLSSKRRIFRELCASPMIKAFALTMPASLWSTVGERHPYGEGFPGPHLYEYAKHGSLFEGDLFKEASNAVTPELVEQLFVSGPAAKVAERLLPFVEHGVSHVVCVNGAPAAGWGFAADSLREQARLNRLLKQMSPGSRSWAKGPVPPPPVRSLSSGGDLAGAGKDS